MKGRAARQERLGATWLGDGNCRFLVWASSAQEVVLRLVSPQERLIPLEKTGNGYYGTVVSGITPGTRYLYRLDGRDYPDPASAFQPEGVHGSSEVIDPAFSWTDQDWTGRPLADLILYELHVGTFTEEGTFDGTCSRLGDLREMGITAVELMPVAQFPGGRNWGYDGVHPFAVQNSYGGPAGLKRLVDACHRERIAVVLDVVYNHLGPEGNYLGAFAPYFNGRYATPWGPAINFDGPESHEVRRYFLENAQRWFEEFHIDALRIDAIHGIVDTSAIPYLQELATETRRWEKHLGRKIHLMPESDLNDARVVQPSRRGGHGLDAVWNDDFHHALHTLLTGESAGYYRDFGKIADLAKAFREGFVYSGQYSRYRRRRHGNSSRTIPADRLVVFSQNHDQVGNRGDGARLSRLVSFDRLKLSAAVVLLSPFVPLLFMGEEYGEKSPFHFFISHGDPAVIEATRRGRREEFSAFDWGSVPPDPQDEATFRDSRIDWGLRDGPSGRLLLDFYRQLIRLRGEIPALAALSKKTMEVRAFEREKALYVRRWSESVQVFFLMNFGPSEATPFLKIPPGRWMKLLDSSEPQWGGPGGRSAMSVDSQGEATVVVAPHSVLLYGMGSEGSED